LPQWVLLRKGPWLTVFDVADDLTAMLEHELGRPEAAIRVYLTFKDKLIEIGAEPLPVTTKLAYKHEKKDQPDHDHDQT